MAFLYPSIHNITKTLTIIVTALLCGNATGAVKTDPKQQKPATPIIIDRILADPVQKVIVLECTLLQKEDVDKLKTKELNMQVDIRKKNELLKNVYVKNLEIHSGNKVVLTLQPPLKDAIYGIEKRDFTVQLQSANQNAQVSKTTVLGTAIRLLNMRPYNLTNPFRVLLNSLIITIVISALLALVVLFIKKYRFKKEHVKKYQQVNVEGKTNTDPFTFEPIEATDEVIVKHDRVMLLRSWKRLNAQWSERPIEALEVFFKDDEEDSLFKPTTPTARRINRVWFGVLGSYVAWLLYMLMLEMEFNSYHNLLAAVFDSPSLQVSDLFYNDSLLAWALGLGMGLSFTVLNKLYAKSAAPILKTLYGILIGILILMGFLLLQALLNGYLLNSAWVASLAAWLCIGLALSASIYKPIFSKNTLLAGLFAGIAGFVCYQVAHQNIVIDSLGVEVVFLICLLVTGGIVGWFTYSPPYITPQETPPGSERETQGQDAPQPTPGSTE